MRHSEKRYFKDIAQAMGSFQKGPYYADAYLCKRAQPDSSARVLPP